MEWGGDGEGMGRGWKWGDQFRSNLGPRWTGSYQVKEGFQVSKGEIEGKQIRISKGEVKSKGIAPYHVVDLYIYVHNNCLNVECS